MSKVFNSTNTAKTINDAISNIMGTTTTSQGATADGLIVKEDLQPVVECVNGFDYAVHIKTITGIPPLTFHSMGQTLIWSIEGNTDSGDSVGDRTKNLWDGAIGTDNAILTEQGSSMENVSYALSDYLPVTADTSYIYHFYHNNEETRTTYSVSEYDSSKTAIRPIALQTINEKRNYDIEFTTGSETAYIRINWKKTYDDNKMLIAGTTPIPYEPYGYDIPIVVNNTDTYHCYITDVLRKSDGETPVYDTMNSDGTIIRRVDTDGTPLETPIEETYTAPNVIVSWGNNTIDVDTTVAPTSMTITYKDN